MNLVRHPEIHQHLCKRWEELGLKPSDIVRDAEERGMDIPKPRLSEYKNMMKPGKLKSGITLEQLTFLCIRYGIFINIGIGEPVIKNGKVEYKVMPYDELKCIKRLKKAFPDLK